MPSMLVINIKVTMENRIHPEAIFIQLNTYCNATCINCPHIFTYKEIHEKGSMNEKTWHKILADLIEMDYRGQVGFYLHHEPLIDATLYDKIKEVNSRTNAYVVISTNGSLLNEGNRKKLIEANPQKVHININSGIEEEYEKSMGLSFKNTIKNIQDFIQEAEGLIEIEINCPVMEGYDAKSLKILFPSVKVNLDNYANSRGGLLPNLFGKVKGSHFKVDDYCVQPSKNFNILFDGSVIVCCIDWMHESKKDFCNVNDYSIIELYSKVRELEESFKEGNYSKYKMCELCSSEMGFSKKPDSDKKLQILITNHHLLDYTGSEILTFTLANQLKNNGHQITVYSKYLDNMKQWFDEKNIRVVNRLESISGELFDVAHIHHNISAIEVRRWFPKIPLVFYSQGVLPFLEHPPLINVDIQKYVAISEEVRDNIESFGIAPEKIEIVRNLIDNKLFYTSRPPNQVPQNVLVISGRIDQVKEQIIREACQEKGLGVEFLGGRFGSVNQTILKEKIECADIIFSLGRGAIEAMIAGRAVIIFDYLGGDGMVTVETYAEIQKNNFSGRRFGYSYSKDEIVSEIEKYDLDTIETVRNRAVEDYSAFNASRKLEKIYIDAIKGTSENHLSDEDMSLVEFTNNIIQETYNYAYESGFRNGRAYLEATANARIEKNILNELVENKLNPTNDVNQEMKESTTRDKVFQKALVAKEKQNLKALVELSQIHIKHQNYFDAYLLLQKVLKDNPVHELAQKNLNLLNEQITKKKKEIKWNSKNSSDTLMNAERLIEKQNLSGAKEKLFTVLNLEPQHIEALNDLSVVSILEKNFDYAYELINVILRIEHANEVAQGNLKYLEEISSN